MIKNQKGFTITEIMVSLGIMALGFLAMSEMEFLSLRQKQRAEEGTVATNVIQFISDRDMAEVRRIHLLNSNAVTESQDGREPNLNHCSGSTTSICGACPCNPLIAITPNPNPGVTESTCAAIDREGLDPYSITLRDDLRLCKNDAEALSAKRRPVMFVVKEAVTTQTGTTIQVAITYAVKSPARFERSGFSVATKDSLASQRYNFTAHIDSDADKYSALGWTSVRVPHLP